MNESVRVLPRGKVHRVAIPASQSVNGRVYTACGRFLVIWQNSGPWAKDDVESCYRCRIARSPRWLDVAQKEGSKS